MIVAVELKGRHGWRIFRGPEEQVAALRAIAHERLFGFCLMSTHLHLMWEVDSLEDAQRITRVVARRLDATADERGVARLDEPHLQVLPDDHAALRYLAYIHGNPVTAGMLGDPLTWAFSSHRDVLGLRHARWFSPERVRARMDEKHNVDWLHRTAKGFAPAPKLEVGLVPRTWPIEPFEMIRRSVGAVYGLTDAEMRAPKRGAPARHCIVRVAHLEGWTLTEIALALGWNERHAKRIGLEPTPEVLMALAVLRDQRMRPTGSAWWIVPAEARGPNLWAEWREVHGKIPSVGISSRRADELISTSRRVISAQEVREWDGRCRWISASE
jgi:hypothetical protein